MLDLSRLNTGQRDAVTHIDGPCRVIAGAGSGKTMVLTHRIGHMIESGIDPKNILAVTFTKKAAGEMKERLIKLIGDDGKSVLLGTFHHIGFKIIRNEKNGDIELAEEGWQKQIMTQIISPVGNLSAKALGLDITPEEGLAFVSWQKNHLLQPNDKLDMSIATIQDEEKYRIMYRTYEKIKKQEHKIDFDDMLVDSYFLLKKNPKIRQKYSTQFQYILVDEFQDTNVAQYQFVKLLGGKHRNVFVVGDARQAIYSWRASKVEFILDFEADWKGAKTILLNDNYRSTKEIVDLSSVLIKHSTIVYPGECRSGKGILGAKASYIESINEDQEAEMISLIIQKLHDEKNVPFKDFAILYRLNAQARALEDSLMAAQVPYYVNGSPGFYGHKEIKDILAYLKLLENPYDIESFKRIINVPDRGINATFTAKMEEAAQFYGMSILEAVDTFWDKDKRFSKGALEFTLSMEHVKNFADSHPVSEVITELRQQVGYDQWVSHTEIPSEDPDNGKIDNLNTFVTAATKFETIAELLEYIAMAEQKAADNKDKDKVQMMTLHRSKGLEFPYVFMVGMVNGLLPHKKSCIYQDGFLLKESVEEERRLCYVGITRAKEKLFLSTFDKMGNTPVERSLFFTEIREELRPFPI